MRAQRIHLVDANTFEDDMVVTEPVAVTKPWNVTRNYRKSTPDMICTENQRNPLVQVVLPTDKPGSVLGAQPTPFKSGEKKRGAAQPEASAFASSNNAP